MNEQEIWSAGRKAAQEVASRYLSIEVNFTASPVPGDESTLSEVYLVSKGARREQLYPLGVVSHSDQKLTTSTLRQKFERAMERKVQEFLGDY